ncbi:unnamed protein product [Heligmosomoides polygyrus]|uniref:Kinesin motor domain-containing protein n=1 Tax=Heligmosomoides polygyrus TaxID=6339 RepID=A0A183F1W4_HELPZ|nr:unnamed protein product [Heligmosomoides polygyrus]
MPGSRAACGLYIVVRSLVRTTMYNVHKQPILLHHLTSDKDRVLVDLSGMKPHCSRDMVTIFLSLVSTSRSETFIVYGDYDAVPPVRKVVHMVQHLIVAWGGNGCRTAMYMFSISGRVSQVEREFDKSSEA